MKTLIYSILIAIVLMAGIVWVLESRTKTVDIPTRVINGHTYILFNNTIIHDYSCPAPDSTHIQYVRILPRL